VALSSSFRTNAALAEIFAVVLETCACLSLQCQEERLGKAALAMESRCNEDFTLLDLAREAGYAENYFSGEFRRLYGLSPMEYLREQRLSLAKVLLRQGTLSIKEAAHASGFQDPPLFFKSLFTSPGRKPISIPQARFACRLSRGLQYIMDPLINY
jgi:AraC-like DNA-binding protein